MRTNKIMGIKVTKVHVLTICSAGFPPQWPADFPRGRICSLACAPVFHRWAIPYRFSDLSCTIQGPHRFGVGLEHRYRGSSVADVDPLPRFSWARGSQLQACKPPEMARPLGLTALGVGLFGGAGGSYCLARVRCVTRTVGSSRAVAGVV